MSAAMSRLHSLGIADLSPGVLQQLISKHPTRDHSVPDASEEPSCQHARDTRWPTVSHKHGARRASTCAAAAGIPAAGRGQHACTFPPATSASHPCSCLTPPKPGGIAPRCTAVVQLLCSRASEPDVAPWQRLAAMVEVVAGTVGDRLAATGGAVDGSETRNLESEGFAREEISVSV